MINNVVLMGRITHDVDLKQTTSGKSVVSFSIAVERSYTKAGEAKQTDFFSIVAWGNNAEFISKYFKKGDMIALTGELQTRGYTAKDGKERKLVEVLAQHVSFCGNSGKTGEKTQNEDNYIANKKSGLNIEFEEITDDIELPF